MTEYLFGVVASQSETIKALVLSSGESSHLRFIYFSATSIISTVLGAVLAYTAGHLSHKKHLKPESAKSLLGLLEKFETQCLEYWSKEHDEKESVIEEAKIKAGHKQLRLYAKHGDYGLKKEKKLKLEELISDLFDEATGGDFESKNRKASRQRIQKIAMTTSKISPILIEKSFE
ncbi:hypothetical protein RSO68_08100 [Halomonas saccharevitans]|uniref:SMODS and SLOG-associating 2TM effector domain-containing protein n=1 Tax=Halomonas saccharevitans TaxID=416872 RepID=A0ABU3NFX9_9GAMM|nr:hypothetical protein [Halomonas saccharevitans]MDT8879428.1 hypothetical protein [Halomonas saccharevitans]